jgi:hypothetical protein
LKLKKEKNMNTTRTVLVDDSGKTFVLEAKNNYSFGLTMETEKRKNILSELKEPEESAKIFLKILEKSKYVKYQIDNNKYIQINENFTIKSLIEKLIEMSNANNGEEQLIENKDFFRTSISNFTNILNSIILMNEKNSQSFIEYVYEDLELVNNSKVILSLLRGTIDSIIQNIDKKLTSRYELSLYSILSGFDVDRKGYYYDYDYLKKIVETYSSFVAKSEQERMYTRNYRSTSLQAISEELLFGNYNRLIEDQKLLDIVKKIMVEGNITNLEDIKEKLTNKALTNIIELLDGTIHITKNSLFILEIYRRKLTNIINKDILDDMKINFFSRLSNLPKWPSAYIEEIKSIIKDIFIDMNESEFERVFYTMDRYDSVFTKEQIFNFLFEENLDLVVNVVILKGTSKEYFKETARAKMIEPNFRYRSVFSDRHSHLLKDNIKDSIYLKLAIVLNIMRKTDVIYSESLITEAFKELFKALIPATKSERDKVTEMLSYLIHHDKYSDNFDSTNLNKIKIMFEQMSNSNLKNVTIERMIDKKDYETWEYSRGSRGRKMFGLDYVDILAIIQDLPLRNIFTATILKIQLN